MNKEFPICARYGLLFITGRRPVSDRNRQVRTRLLGGDGRRKGVDVPRIDKGGLYSVPREVLPQEGVGAAINSTQQVRRAVKRRLHLLVGMSPFPLPCSENAQPVRARRWARRTDYVPGLCEMGAQP